LTFSKRYAIVVESSITLNWRCLIKRKIILSVLSFVLILALIASTACVPKRDGASPSNPASTDDDRIAALESKVSQLQSKIASLPAGSGGNYDSDIDNIYAEIESLREELGDILTEVDDMLAGWEEEQQTVQEEEEQATDVRWSRDITSNYTEADVMIDYWQTPSRMDSEGDYTIKVTLMNNRPVAITDFVLDLTFTPSGKPYVDQKNTFLDTMSSPYTLWDTEIVTRGDDEYCRRISNMSEKIKLEPGESNTLQLQLEFILTYK